MRKLEFTERKYLIELFNNPSSAIILASLYTNIGETWINDKLINKNGIIFVENTFYIGGHSIDKELIEFLFEQILRKEISLYYIIPQNNDMIAYFDEYFNQVKYKYSIIKSERHLMDIDMNNINHDKLMSFINDLPVKYQLKPINEELFYTAISGDKYLNNFIKLFSNYKDFEKEGFGFFILDGSEIIAGISSFARYKEGVEVQIAVKPEYRGQHLARILGAEFILECKKRDLYPWWDCANPISEHIATEFGYVLKQITTIYKCMLNE
ncbi:GNAT family N-acetyltransferase [Lachnoclostridium phytofermentans]|uniref:GCN5-related N-acetyltransferase n=1 Tax=Lachnoclostridium phytofermentans (strain ATCC 700394 / DSM 18823 / ISDg) TaxID=357809 RepID=A9KRU3_LACP7|nr:GNAT family N-acetyltransferase [Lachnoclostridium phytofermentans]ABX43587.1 GCN5-related N-acetyltransferase [Lachnoclostridium phytofermentans ISDg]